MSNWKDIEMNGPITPYNEPFILQRADPFVCRGADGTWYFTASYPDYDRILLRASDTMEGLRSAPERLIWTRHERGPMSRHIWAPEMHFVFGKWYIYFAASEWDDMWKLRPYVLECDGDPMTGAWHELGQMQPCEGDPQSFTDFSLDATIFPWQGEYYYIWAQKASNISNLYIAKMAAPNRLGTVMVMLTTPDYDWERVDFWVNEGPACLVHDGKLYLTYSASGTGSCYCVGMLTCDLRDDLLDPRSWRKERWPVLGTDAEKGIYGPGHNSFVKDDEGRDIMVYHARTYDGIRTDDPLFDPNRHAHYLYVTYDAEGRPVFRVRRQGAATEAEK